MTSPFLERPEADWIASNELAFAIHDRYPVSPGHALVIPRRLIATWFEASREERQAIFDLVDEVKRLLDARTPPPDGYNIGINCGKHRDGHRPTRRAALDRTTRVVAVAVPLEEPRPGVKASRAGEDEWRVSPEAGLLSRRDGGHEVSRQLEERHASRTLRQQDGVNFKGVIFAHQLHVTIGRCVGDLELIEPQDRVDPVAQGLKLRHLGGDEGGPYVPDQGQQVARPQPEQLLEGAIRIHGEDATAASGQGKGPNRARPEEKDHGPASSPAADGVEPPFSGQNGRFSRQNRPFSRLEGQSVGGLQLQQASVRSAALPHNPSGAPAYAVSF
jgi:hypothetical protein